MPRGRVPSTARAPSTPEPRCRRPPASSSRPTSSGADKGRLPGKFISDVGKTSTFSNIFEVADNAPGAPQTVSTLSGLGTLTATCNDQAVAAGVEDPISTISFNNASGEIVNVARRVGNGDGALTVAANQTVDVDQHRRLEHVHVPHRAPLAERDHHRRRAPGRPRHARGHLCRLRCRYAGPSVAEARHRPPARPVPIEADHLLDAARAVRVADRGRQQAGPERDPLLGRVGAQRVGVAGDRLERRPDGRGALRPVAAAAVALVELARDLRPVERAQVLVDVPEAAVGEVAARARVLAADQRVEPGDRQRAS